MKKPESVQFKTSSTMIPFWDKLFRGEYEIVTPTPVRTIVDVGGCHGAFVLWAVDRWPELERVTVFEPKADSFELLSANLAPLGDGVKLLNEAVVANHYAGKGQIALRTPSNGNIGASSVYYGYGDGEAEEYVSTCSTMDVPMCDLLKLDCEGAELDIIRELVCDSLGLVPVGDRPSYVVLEYHSPQIRVEIQRLMIGSGVYELVGAEEYGDNLGIQKYRKVGLCTTSMDYTEML